MNRKEIADLIFVKLKNEESELKCMFDSKVDGIGFFYVDDLLPEELALKVYSEFPKPESMKVKKSLREYKYIEAQMNLHDPILEEVIYAFQDTRIVEIIGKVTGIQNMDPDTHLYAGGISMMGDKQFLNPHLDNSHDKDRNKWRVLNLLYYVTPNWPETSGGNLELWPNGLEYEQETIHSRFNRLAVMVTHGESWHSVSPINNAELFRCCVSNYYFSDTPVKSSDAFHITSFRGRPEQPLVDKILQADIYLRSGIRKVFKKGIIENKHVYKK